MTVKIIYEHGHSISITCPDCLLQTYDLFADPSLQTINHSRLLQQALVDCDGILWVGECATLQNLAAAHDYRNHYNAALWCIHNGEVYRLHNGFHPQIVAVLASLTAQMEGKS